MGVVGIDSCRLGDALNQYVVLARQNPSESEYRESRQRHGGHRDIQVHRVYRITQVSLPAVTTEPRR